MERALAMRDARKGRLPAAMLRSMPNEAGLALRLLSRDPGGRPDCWEVLRALEEIWGRGSDEGDWNTQLDVSAPRISQPSVAPPPTVDQEDTDLEKSSLCPGIFVPSSTPYHLPSSGEPPEECPSAECGSRYRSSLEPLVECSSLPQRSSFATSTVSGSPVRGFYRGVEYSVGELLGILAERDIEIRRLSKLVEELEKGKRSLGVFGTASGSDH